MSLEADDNHVYNDSEFLGLFPDPALVDLLRQLESQDMASCTLLLNAGETLLYLRSQSNPLFEVLFDEISEAISTSMCLTMGKWYKDDEEQ